MLYVTKSGSTYEVDHTLNRVRLVYRPDGCPGGSKRLSSSKWLYFDDCCIEKGCRMMFRFGTDTVETSRVEDIVDLDLEGN